jgi:hypothetical protein
MPRNPGLVTEQEMVYYTVRGCSIALPGAGMSRAHAVVRVFALRESPAVAIFLNAAHAREYADYLMKNRIEVL